VFNQWPGLETGGKQPLRTEQHGLALSPNFLPFFLQHGNVLGNFFLPSDHRPTAAALVIEVAPSVVNRKKPEHREADARHLGQVRTRAAEQHLLLPLPSGLGTPESSKSSSWPYRSKPRSDGADIEPALFFFFCESTCWCLVHHLC